MKKILPIRQSPLRTQDILIKPKKTSWQYSPQIIKLLRIIIVYSSPILRPTQLSLCVEQQFFQNQVNLLEQTTLVTKTEALEAYADELNNFYQSTQRKLKSKMCLKYQSLTNQLKSFSYTNNYLLLGPSK
ncbi:Hypothetical_protein [Hexamita inflata]|uniref:Hypothetical_protein n=1 Tax=Hexamita inflata TaxID=28002 RepID=A0AA86V621_9EUKA|nr:Hypothetical protein HINF_LOCUS65342 [Hexamita inflata]